MKYFADTKEGAIEFAKVRYRPIKPDTNGPCEPWGYHNNQWIKVTRVIKYNAFGSKHECDARCMNASGRTMNCECSCGGINHGKGKFNCE